jgi:hypothetical protein
MSSTELVARILIASAGVIVCLLVIFDTAHKISAPHVTQSFGGHHVQVIEVPKGASQIEVILKGSGGGVGSGDTRGPPISGEDQSDGDR